METEYAFAQAIRDAKGQEFEIPATWAPETSSSTYYIDPICHCSSGLGSEKSKASA